MSDLARANLQRALDITVEMIDAAISDNWPRVVELDAQRQVCLEQFQAGPQHREALLALQVHNRTLLERAHRAHDMVQQQLGRHQYNHRALRTYITSSSSC